MPNSQAGTGRFQGTDHRRSNLATVKLLGRKKDHEQEAEAPAATDTLAAEAGAPPRRTDPKGRPTPKRSDARRNARKGPVAPAPMTAAEARARRKSLRGPKLSREERRAERVASR